MKIKKPPSYCEMRDEVLGKFSEYGEEKANPTDISLSYIKRGVNSY